MQKHITNRDMHLTQGVIWKQMLWFSLPLAVGLLFQQLYNTVDAVVVGRYVGKQALAAVGSTASIVNMLVGVCAGVATGAGVVISQCYGTHDDASLRDAVRTTMVITFVVSALATVAGLLLIDPMLRLMKTPEDVYGEARIYLVIYFAGITGLLVYNMGSGVLRAVGDSKRPLYFLIFSALINIVFDLVFVLEFGLGVAGVAYATIISQFLSALLVLVVLTRTDAPYGIRWKELRVTKNMLARILRIGLPAGVQQGITSFSNVFVQSYINFFGSSCMAGWTGYNKLDIFILIPVQSISLASTTFVGQNYGAGKLDRAKKGVSLALWISIAITAVLSVLLILWDRPLLMLFNGEAEVVEYGERFITLISPFYVLICFNQIYSGALRGAGNSYAPTVIMLASFVAFRQVYLYVNSLLGNGFVPVALAYPVGWVLCSALMIIAYRRSVICKGRPQTDGEA